MLKCWCCCYFYCSKLNENISTTDFVDGFCSHVLSRILFDITFTHTHIPWHPPFFIIFRQAHNLFGVFTSVCIFFSLLPKFPIYPSIFHHTHFHPSNVQVLSFSLYFHIIIIRPIFAFRFEIYIKYIFSGISSLPFLEWKNDAMIFIPFVLNMYFDGLSRARHHPIKIKSHDNEYNPMKINGVCILLHQSNAIFIWTHFQSNDFLSTLDFFFNLWILSLRWKKMKQL